MKKNFLLGVLLFVTAIIFASIRFDIPYDLNFSSLINRINLEGFVIEYIFYPLFWILFICLILSFIPFKNAPYKFKFSRMFLILNCIVFVFAIYSLVDSTIIYSKIICKYRNPDFIFNE